MAMCRAIVGEWELHEHAMAGAELGRYFTEGDVAEFQIVATSIENPPIQAPASLNAKRSELTASETLLSGKAVSKIGPR